MTTDPADIVNRAFDSIGAPVIIGSLYDGSVQSEAARRIYGRTLRQLLRSSHWSCARKRGFPQLLGDSTGQTPDVGTIVEAPWIYAYAWPIDAVAIRWVPWSGLPPSALALAGGPPIPGNIQPPNPAVPIMQNLECAVGAALSFQQARPLSAQRDRPIPATLPIEFRCD